MGSPEFLAGLQDMLSLVELAKRPLKDEWFYVWEDVAEIINKYSPVSIDPVTL